MAENDATRLCLDVDFETARALHRVVRAMHDGECPKCHRVFDSRLMVNPYAVAMGPPENDHICPRCGFKITADEMRAGIEAFAPVMDRNLEVFEQWRKARKS